MQDGLYATRARLVPILEKLGEDNVRNGLRARGHGWSTCFLARAYGDSRELMDHARKTSKEICMFAACAFGMDTEEIDSIVKMWDTEEIIFRYIAREWIKQSSVIVTQALTGPTVPEPAFRKEVVELESVAG